MGFCYDRFNKRRAALPLARQRRLAKRHGDTSLARYRRQGVAPEAIIGALARSLGWVAEGTPCRAQDLVGRFDLSTIPREPMTWDDDGCLQLED